MSLLYTAPGFALPEGFVYLHDVDPSIIVNLRYAGEENFIGKPINGYEKNVAILTEQAASALKMAQNILKQDGYNLVIYDTYRPQQATDQFKQWSLDAADQKMKSWFYPRVNKNKLHDLNYITEKSSHSRGSTADLSIIKSGEKLHAITPVKYQLQDRFEMLLLDDGTVDMGSSFDVFDNASHYVTLLISDEHKKRRAYLKNIMVSCGFMPYPEEWWHFTLKDEPFPDQYFNFPVTAP